MVDLALWNEKRKELKISLIKLAEMTDISISTIKDIFRGATTDPRIETVQRIERALGIDAKKETPTIPDGVRELAELIAQMTENEVKELSTFVDYIISKRG